MRAFVARYDATHGLTVEELARHLRLPPIALAQYAESHRPPRWLLLAVVGVGTARGIPVEELRWLLAAPADPHST